jgi:DNA-directed RNA polymerase subunit beta
LKPYRKVTNGVVDLVSTPIYLSAEEEEGMISQQTNGYWKNTAENVIRQEGDFL